MVAPARPRWFAPRRRHFWYNIQHMKILGEAIFAKDADGKLLSRIGTIFFRTPGLVTKRGVHAMQRVMWITAVNEDRAAAGLPTRRASSP